LVILVQKDTVQKDVGFIEFVRHVLKTIGADVGAGILTFFFSSTALDVAAS
jgi:hypothetical protein